METEASEEPTVTPTGADPVAVQEMEEKVIGPATCTTPIIPANFTTATRITSTLITATSTTSISRWPLLTLLPSSLSSYH